MHLDMNLPVVLFTLFVSALLQDMISPTAMFPVKFGFLTAVACYHAMTKPVAVGLATLVWAGVLIELLGGLPLFSTISFFLLLYGLLRLMQRFFLTATLFQGTFLVAGVSVVQTLWTYAWLGSSGPSSWQDIFVAAGFSAPAGLVAGFVGFTICGLTDRLSGNVMPAKANHGILWPEINR